MGTLDSILGTIKTDAGKVGSFLTAIGGGSKVSFGGGAGPSGPVPVANPYGAEDAPQAPGPNWIVIGGLLVISALLIVLIVRK